MTYQRQLTHLVSRFQIARRPVLPRSCIHHYNLPSVLGRSLHTTQKCYNYEEADLEPANKTTQNTGMPNPLNYQSLTDTQGWGIPAKYEISFCLKYGVPPEDQYLAAKLLQKFNEEDKWRLLSVQCNTEVHATGLREY
ncbi:hypothetical protein TWF694_000958 [Orbilia ellipsospora]|uniref:Uncharacterized protein n=1 Tax=Orbilia ellipsospora TaxID=2528407 RepID=A0AAV9XRN1_9PEZI